MNKQQHNKKKDRETKSEWEIWRICCFFFCLCYGWWWRYSTRGIHNQHKHIFYIFIKVFCDNSQTANEPNRYEFNKTTQKKYLYTQFNHKLECKCLQWTSKAYALFSILCFKRLAYTHNPYFSIDSSGHYVVITLYPKTDFYPHTHNGFWRMKKRSLTKVTKLCVKTKLKT